MIMNCYRFRDGIKAYLVEGQTVPIRCSPDVSIRFDTEILGITEMRYRELKCTYKQWEAYEEKDKKWNKK